MMITIHSIAPNRSRVSTNGLAAAHPYSEVGIKLERMSFLPNLLVFAGAPAWMIVIAELPLAMNRESFMPERPLICGDDSERHGTKKLR
jgi:hypothetical protein